MKVNHVVILLLIGVNVLLEHSYLAILLPLTSKEKEVALAYLQMLTAAKTVQHLIVVVLVQNTSLPVPAQSNHVHAAP